MLNMSGYCSSTQKANLNGYKLKYDSSVLQFGVKRPPMYYGQWNTDKLQPQIKDFNEECFENNQSVNLLHIPGLKEMGFISRTLYYNYTVLSKNTDHGYPSISTIKNKILADERLHHAIQKTLFEEEENGNLDLNIESERNLEENLQRKAVEMFNEMIATVSSKALKFCGWLFITLLRQLTSSVHLHQAQLNMLRALSKCEEPIIYFPLHFSHLDYILLSLLSYHNNIRSPFVASGGNLRVPIFSDVMRRVGGFFIRRKIDSGAKKDYIYRAVLHSYVTELLKQNQSLEIFIEGTRTRSGLPNQPKTGLLSVAVEAIEKGFVSDIVMVPVCVSYEKLLEGSFSNELLGQPKVAESFLSSLAKIARIIFSGYYGHIHVNFGAPQSLKKTLEHIRSSPACNFSNMTLSISSSRSLYDQVKVDQLQENEQEISNYNNILIQSSSQSLSVYGCNKENSLSREVITLLGEHIVYSSLKCKVIMSTNIVAFLLLHKWRNGVSMSVLTDSFQHIITELLTRKIDVGFSGDLNEVVLHAVNLLGSSLVQLECKSISCNVVSSNYKLMTDHIAPLEDESSFKSLEHNSNDSGKESLTMEDEDFFSNDRIKTGDYMKLSESGIFEKEQLSEEKLSDASEATTADDLFLVDSDDLEEDTKDYGKKSDVKLFLTPCLAIPNVFDIAYYANALTPVFALESVAALAVNAVTKFHFSTFEKIFALQENLLALNLDELPVSLQKSFFRSMLLDKMLELVDILQIDLILCDVTDDLKVVANQAIDTLILNGCLTCNEYGKSATTKHAENLQDICFHDIENSGNEGEQWLKINLSETLALIERQSILASFVECYVVAASQLFNLIRSDTQVSEVLLKESILHALRDRVHSNTAVRPECASSDTVKCALRCFEFNGVIKITTVNKLKLVNLTEDFNDKESITNLISRISQFLL